MQNVKISFAGAWTPLLQTGPSSDVVLATNFYGLFKPAGSQKYGLVTTGWKYQDKSVQSAKVNIGLFLPDSAGNLRLETSKVVDDPSTNGAGSVVVADFDKNGLDDIFLAAHSEDPMIPRESTAYLQSASGKFIKLNIGDSIIAHDAKLIELNGAPAVLTSTFDASDKTNKAASANPIYIFNNGKFELLNSTKSWYDLRFSNDGSFLKNQTMSSEIGKFFGDKLLRIHADNTTYSKDWSKVLTSDISLYEFQANESVIPTQRITPYLSTLPQYKSYSSLWGEGLTHVYRIWKEDLNQDGQLDLMAAQSMWSEGAKAYPSALQILLNDGNGKLVDKTLVLNPNMSLNTEEVSYTPFFLDIDRSGIKTLLFPNHANSSYERQTAYVLLNDGTGKIHVGLHNEFVDFAKQVSEFISRDQSFNQTYQIASFPYGRTISFIPIPDDEGRISFLAVAQASLKNDSKQQVYLYFNFDLNYDPGSQFTQAVHIEDRNFSKNIRTWAGNDVIKDRNPNSDPAKINGGAGIDTMSYSGKYSAYTVGKIDSFWSVGSKSAASRTDTLSNIERLRFSDVSVALDTDGNAGKVAKLLGVTFGGSALTNKEYVGVGLSLLDQGVSYQDLAALAVSVTKKSSSTDICNLLWINIFGKAPTAADVAPYKALLDSGQISIGALTTLAADTSFNSTNINLVGLSQTGIEYI
jgi:hypothetical protein